jgi:hypothetical protein
MDSSKNAIIKNPIPKKYKMQKKVHGKSTKLKIIKYYQPRQLVVELL